MTIEQLLTIVFQEMEDMSKMQREEFLNKVREKYCMHCGKDHSDSILPCPCSNDE